MVAVKYERGKGCSIVSTESGDHHALTLPVSEYRYQVKMGAPQIVNFIKYWCILVEAVDTFVIIL